MQQALAPALAPAPAPAPVQQPVSLPASLSSIDVDSAFYLGANSVWQTSGFGSEEMLDTLQGSLAVSGLSVRPVPHLPQDQNPGCCAYPPHTESVRRGEAWVLARRCLSLPCRVQ